MNYKLLIMMLKGSILFLMILILFSCSNDRKIPHKAEKGVIDLRDWDFEKDGIISLDGDWEFYWHEFLSAKDFDTIQEKHFLKVPDVWNGYKWNEISLPGTGFASYRLKVLLNPNKKILSFKINTAGTAYQLYINDSLTCWNGKVGKSKEESSPKYFPLVIDYENIRDTLVINTNISNFHYKKGGLWLSIDLGNKIDITSKREKLLSFDVFQAGASFLIALYFIILYSYRRKEKPALYIGLGFLGILIRSITINEIFLVSLFPDINWELLIKIELESGFFVIYFFNLFFSSLFKEEYSRKVLWVYNTLLIIFMIIILVLPSLYSSETVPYMQICMTMVLYQLYVGIKALRKKREGALIMLIGFSMFAIVAINDILFLNYIINTLNLTNFGVLAFFISQIILLSRKFAREFSQIENFSNDLETTVEERTKELNEKNIKLEDQNNIISVEREKSDKLLLNVLPEQIADRLKEGETTIADHFDEASIVFIDIVDFTKSSAGVQPKRVVEVLNVLYTKLDSIAQKHGLEKIKTIGDCYMAAAGVPIPRNDNTEMAANFAIEAMQILKDYNTGDGTLINFRCGIDCGPVVAGVIGEQKFIYDLWGDAVNTASRMEAYGEPGRIQVTERFFSKSGIRSEELGIKFEERGEIEIKGKGLMKTYFLIRN